MPYLLDGQKHADKSRIMNTTFEHALGCNMVYNAIVAQFSINRANDGWTFELLYVVKGQLLIDALGDAAMAMVGSILLASYYAILLGMVHHLPDDVFVWMVEIGLK